MKEPGEAKGTKGRGEAGGVESRGAGWQTMAEPEREGSPAELMNCRATVERRELGAMAEPKGQWAEAESGPRRLEAESRETNIFQFLFYLTCSRH